MFIQYLPNRKQPEVYSYTREDSPILGIDFGTSNSVISYYIEAPHFHGTKPICHAQTGDVLFPSVVFFDKTNGLVSGPLACQRRLLYPNKVLSSVKRKLVCDTLIINDTSFSPLQIVEEIFRGLLTSVKNESPNAKPKFVSITVPYSFMQPQNLFIRQAAENAFLSVFGCCPQIETIPEPVAASLYWLYKNQSRFNGPKNTLVFDIGGGTFDLSLVHSEVSHNRISCEVIATGGCDKLGGVDIDSLLFDYLVDTNAITFDGLSERERLRFSSRMMNSVITAKCELSASQQTSILVEAPPTKDGSFVECVLERRELERLLYADSSTEPSFMARLSGRIDDLMERNAVKNRIIDNVILVGGPTRMPVIQNFVRQKFPNSNILTSTEENVDFICVSQGAALYSALISQEVASPFGINIKEISYQTRIPHSIFIERYDRTLDLIIKEGSTCPVIDKKQYYPSKVSGDGKYILLSKINIYQKRENEQPIHVGSIDVSHTKLYTHGRSIDQIPIIIQIEADSTLIKVSVIIEKSQKDNSDFCFEEYIKL